VGQLSPAQRRRAAGDYGLEYARGQADHRPFVINAALELSHRPEYVQHRPPGGAAGVDPLG